MTISEGGSAGYVVGLTAAPSSTVTVTVDVPADSDATAAPESLRFTTDNWATGQTVTVTAGQDDDAVDDAAGISHDFTGGGYSITGAATVVVTIDDDDTAGVTVTPTVLTVTEGETESYTVVLHTEPSAELTIEVSGHAGTDLTLSPESLTFTAANWDTPQPVTVTAAEDDDAVADDAVAITHAVSNSAAEYQSVTAAGVTVTIIENDTPTLAVADAGASEGDQNPAVAFAVTLSTASSDLVTVIYATSDGTALAGSDYAASSGVLTFPALSTASQTIPVPVVDDDYDEAETETFTLTLSAAVAATLPGGQDTLAVTGTIADNDGVPELSIADASLEEADADLEFAVSLRNEAAPELGSGRTVTVAYAVAAGTAAAGSDYTAVAAGTLTFAAGQIGKTIAVPVREDSYNEAAETLTVSLSAPADPATPLNATLADAAATGTITDDDALRVAVTAAASVVAEGDEARFPVELTGGTSTAAVAVTYTVGGTATAADYTAPSGTLTLVAGAESGTIVIPTTPDEVVDPGETLVVTLSAARTAGTATVDPAAATTTIANQGTETVVGGVTASLESTTAIEGEPAQFAVILSGEVASEVTLSWTTADGTGTNPATAGADYTR